MPNAMWCGQKILKRCFPLIESLECIDLGKIEYCCLCAQSVGHVQLFVTAWTVSCRAPLSMEFSGQEYCSGLPFPPPGDLLGSESKPASLVCAALAGEFFDTVPPGKPPYYI